MTPFTSASAVANANTHHDASSTKTDPDLSLLGALARRMHVQLHLVPSASAGDVQAVAVPTTWHATDVVRQGQNKDKDHDHHMCARPSLALGVAHVPAHAGSASSLASYECQDDNLTLTLVLPPPNLTATLPTSSLAAILSFRIHSHPTPTWFPTSNALLFSHSHTHTLSIPFAPRTVSAIRIELWPVANAQCVQSTPVHVTVIALSHGPLAAAPPGKQLAEHYPSPQSLVASAHASPLAREGAEFGGAPRNPRSHVCGSPQAGDVDDKAWSQGPDHQGLGRGRTPAPLDEDMSHAPHEHAWDYTAVTEGSGGAHFQGRHDPPSLFPSAPAAPSHPSWSQPRTSRPNRCPPAPTAAAYHPNLGVRNGRISKPSASATSLSPHLWGSGCKQGDLPPHQPPSPGAEPATLAAARLMRGVSVVYMTSGAGCEEEMDGGGGRIRVAIIKTPVGMRDFVHEF